MSVTYNLGKVIPDLTDGNLQTIADKIEPKYVGELAEVSEAIVTLQKTDVVQNRDIEMLKAAAQGKLYVEETDTTTKYVKTVPSGALPYASLDMVGGKTIVFNQLVQNIESGGYTVSGITITTSGNKIIVDGTATSDVNTTIAKIPIPNNGTKLFIKNPSGAKIYLQARLGTSWKANIDQRTTEVKAITYSVECDTLCINLFVPNGTTMSNVEYYPNAFDITKIGMDSATADELYSMLQNAYYPYNTGNLFSGASDEIVIKDSDGEVTSTVTIPSAVKALDGYGQSNVDDATEYNYVDFNEKKYYKKGKYVNGTWTADVQTIDISAYLTEDFNILKVEGNGSITFHHPNADDGYLIPVTNKITYQTKVV